MKREYINGLYNDVGSCSVYIDQQPTVGFAGSDQTKTTKILSLDTRCSSRDRTGVRCNASQKRYRLSHLAQSGG